jgi:hypothetical protein
LIGFRLPPATIPTFFNPRSLDSFDNQEMSDLDRLHRFGWTHQAHRSSCVDGQKENVVAIQVIAGERRLRAIHKLQEENRPCKDRRTKKTVPARELYASIPCRMFYDIDDVEALKIAFHENEHHRKLTTREEVELVERMLSNDMTQEQIVDVPRHERHLGLSDGQFPQRTSRLPRSNGCSRVR